MHPNMVHEPLLTVHGKHITHIIICPHLAPSLLERGLKRRPLFLEKPVDLLNSGIELTWVNAVVSHGI